MSDSDPQRSDSDAEWCEHVKKNGEAKVMEMSEIEREFCEDAKQMWEEEVRAHRRRSALLLIHSERNQMAANDDPKKTYAQPKYGPIHEVKPTAPQKEQEPQKQKTICSQ